MYLSPHTFTWLWHETCTLIACVLYREITDDESDTDQMGDDGEAVSEDEAEEPEWIRCMCMVI